MADRADLRRLQAAAHACSTIEAEGSELLAREQRPLGQHQVHARGLHPVDGADGAGKLAFERAQVVDVLDEAGGAERVGLVEDLVADAAALRQPGLGELHAQPRRPGPSAPSGCAPSFAHLEGDALALEVLDDGGGVFEDSSVNSGVICGAVTRMIRKREEADQRRGDGSHRRQPRRAERSQEIATRPCNEQPLEHGALRHPAKFAQVYGFRLVNRRSVNGVRKNKTPAIAAGVCRNRSTKARYCRYCWMRVVRSPARPCRSIEYCQDRNSSTVRV